MQLFTCDHCQQTLYFESTRCVSCGYALGYLPELVRLVSLRQPAAADAGVFEVTIEGRSAARYRQCRNAWERDACNWLVHADSGQQYCRSCRLSEIIPDLSDPANDTAWRGVEAAKRRLLYSLYSLGLPVVSRLEHPGHGLAFRILKAYGNEHVMTGHADGVITLNLDEADSAFRENMREKMGEAYRTVLGHLRHEIGHYYWDRLIRDGGRLDGFRESFGDERVSYEAAIERHYTQGPPAGWGETYISAYASMHPWEDWAETWAHYLHMVDTLDTASSHGLTVKVRGTGHPEQHIATDRLRFFDFAALTRSWGAVTLALNSLNRSMGLDDAYPFVLTPPVLAKLRFVHELVQEGRTSERQVEMSG